MAGEVWCSRNFLQIVQRGGGNDNSPLGKLNKNNPLIRDIVSKCRYFYSKFFNALGRFRRSRSGAILMEFAFAIPVFLALIYYAHDPAKVKRYRRKIQTAGHQIAQIIQNISYNRADKRITKNDIGYAVRMAYLAVFPGVSMVPVADNHLPLGYYFEVYVYYVTGVSSGRASVKWCVQLYWTHDPTVMSIPVTTSPAGIVKYKTNVSPQQIYKGLTSIREGEVKIILECQLRTGTDMYFSNNRSLRNVSPRELFGFLLYTPNCDVDNGTWKSYFVSVAIFTPRDGLFTTSPPS